MQKEIGGFSAEALLGAQSEVNKDFDDRFFLGKCIVVLYYHKIHRYESLLD